MNTASEQRWAEQLRDNIVIGEALDLPLAAPDSADNKSESTFFSIYTPHTTSTSRGAIVLMHGTGAHPDWNDIIHPLRTELPDKGWATLSIQLPLLFLDKKDAQSRTQVIESSVPRIDAAINFLRAKEYHYITLIAHSFGTLMSLNYLQLNLDKTTPEGLPIVNAAVLIGTPSSTASAPLNSPVMLEKIKIPLLDLYGSEDIDSVLRSAKARKTAAMKAQNKNFSWKLLFTLRILFCYKLN
ncbi:MAG: alpha/beta hydrolase family protein [gamma proteobacterium symbiont of Bathyaustriella thionipta]|nr:alpha/beta hydrolase family protein [gamma proteobacterium symbiont of Bathyaustriella thionipta]MCU7948923.1 alpha/beta hydrolase family protein [gamma proteobacterium symbiont of Bathyaustriella thionipta]MCU7954312.1 alpha/beta hydrolase family protein [gamma proteobacterium symbiont of Bathyaustriella thionipta]MCU7955630.1 alpha/beta hydrolase family protein [gamma proteobacterium symbiont of Bathyaustriella thionipta]MCU7966636.1 alpha/beta hydrolase family protein [gamma proteobacteri